MKLDIYGSSRTFPTYEDYAASGKFDESQLEMIAAGFDADALHSMFHNVSSIHDVTPKQVGIYARPEFDDDQMKMLLLGFATGLSIRQVLIYADPAFDADQMKVLWGACKHANNSKMLEEQIIEFADPDFDANQLREIFIGLFEGLSSEQVATYADPDIDVREMRRMRSGLQGR